MNTIVLLGAVILMWIGVVEATIVRVFQMPKWFADPPFSFHLIKKQTKKLRMFWIPLSIAFMLCSSIALVLDWHFPATRNYILAGVGFYFLNGIVSGSYFVKEVHEFSSMSVNAPQTPQLISRTQKWLRLTTIRDVMQLLTAIFMTLAYNRL
jgi:hypothetical protein